MVDYDPPLDPGIRDAVETLVGAGIETFESCEGGVGHAYPVPTIRFHGDRGEGFRALSVVLQSGLPVAELRRVWPVIDSEPTGPWWEITFSTKTVNVTACNKPTTTPTTTAMITSILKEHPEGLAPRAITKAIALRWWPGVTGNNVGPIAWRMWRRGQLHKNGDLYRIRPETAHEA